MPAVSAKQRRFMGAELGRKRAGKRTQTDMTEAQLRHYAMKPRSHMPKGASQSPKGDLGGHRSAEAKSQRFFKAPGRCLYASEYFGSKVGEPGKIGESGPAVRS